MTQQREDGAEDQGLAVLRGIWTAKGHGVADIAPSSTKACKNMKNIGFGGFVDGGVEGESTAGPVDEAQRAAWRDRLVREGKIAPGSTSVRDLVLGRTQPEPQP